MSNGNDRGSASARRSRRTWLLSVFSPELGPGFAYCEFGCGTILNEETMSVDRYPIPGAFGGKYLRNNIRPACIKCNSKDGTVVRMALKEA